MHDDDPDTELIPLDMEAVSRAVAKQDFTILNKMIVSTNNVGADIVILLGMCTLLSNQIKALREEMRELKNVKGTIQ